MKKALPWIISMSLIFLTVVGVLIYAFFGVSDCVHQWDSGRLINDAKCGEGAKVRCTCLLCGETKEKNSLSHNFVAERIVNPGCTIVGYTEYKCSVCEYQCVSDFTNAIGHRYGTESKVSEATCTTGGVNEQVCIRCGDSKKEYIDAIGHTYLLISQTSQYSTYQCKSCSNAVMVKEGETLEEVTANEEIFDVDTTFTFDVVSFTGAEFVKANLKILCDYYEGSEYENSAEVLEKYTLSGGENGIWTVSLPNGYDYATTYSAKLSGGITFSKYSGDKLTFTTVQDPNHVDVYEYTDDIVFLGGLQQLRGGYYPYEITSSTESEYLYLNVQKVDGLAKGMLLCIGEATSKEDLVFGNEIYFGKIYDIYPLANKGYMVVLEAPDMEEIYSELDVYYDGEMDLSNVVIDEDALEAEMMSSLYENDEFVQFLSIVNLSAIEYYAQNGYYAEQLSDIKSFMDNFTFTHDWSRDGNSINAWAKGELSIPIKNSNKQNIGTFSVSVSVGLSTKFEFTADCSIKEKKFFSFELPDFDLKITQTDVFSFDFDVSIDIDYSLEENPYVQNVDTGKIHRSGCVHLNSVKDTSKLKGLSVETAERYIKNNANLACKHCQPTVGFNSQLVVLNTKEKVIHAYGCEFLTSISDSNKKLSKEKASHWIEQGYSCCDWCHPDAREEANYNAIYYSKLYYADWEQIAVDIRQWAKDSGAAEKNQSGVTLFGVDFPIGTTPIYLSFNINFVVTLDIEATFEYEYTFEHVNSYGIRAKIGDIEPYFLNVSSKTTKNHCSAIGEIELRAGFEVDVNINLLGIEEYFSAGITAELGAYARAAGVLEWNQNSTNNYTAAFLEVGLYTDVDVYYKILKWDKSLDVADEKWALFKMGYERAYFGYETYHEKLTVGDYLDIDEKDILKAKYFDLSSMEIKTDELSLNESNKYKVNVYLEDGKYCYIENGKILKKSNAPDTFTDVLIITVTSNTKWTDFKKDSYVYYLNRYEIDLEFGSNLSDGDGDEEEDNTSSKGLEFELDETTNTYGVVGIGTCKDKDIVIPNYYNGVAVTYISSYAFYNCQQITSVTIPSNVTKISGHAFSDCKSFTKTIILNTVTEIGSNAFGGCSKLTIYCEALSKPDGWNDAWNRTWSYGYYEEYDPDVVWGYKNGSGFVPSPNDLEYTFDPNNNGYWVVGIGDCEDTNIVIPDTYNGYPVIGIYDEAFYYERYIESVVIPDTVIYIGKAAFAECVKLKNVTLGNSVLQIDDKAFYYCKSLNYITIPSSVKYIGDEVFYNCDSLIAIDIPNSVDYMGKSVFSWCDLLTAVSLPSNMTTIPLQTFYCCESLTTVNIPSGVTRIERGAFYGCDSLTKITIPKSVEYLGKISFARSENLTTINYLGTKAEWEAIEKENGYHSIDGIYNWDYYSDNYTVYCTDGVITED